MTSQELKTIIDGIFVRLIAAAGTHRLIGSAFAMVQNILDANWSAIYATIPNAATGKAFVDHIITQLEAYTKGNFAETIALDIVRKTIDTYIDKVLPLN